MLLVLWGSPINAADPETDGDGTPFATAFSFEDVDTIAISLEIPGGIEVTATTNPRIRVTLEKQLQTPDPRVREYLDKVTLVGIHTENTLQLNVQFPVLPVSPAVSSQEFQLLCKIETPADVSLKLQTTTGDIRIHGIRGRIEAETETGNVEMMETVGRYDIRVKQGDINGQILLTHGQSRLETEAGSVRLTLLDSVAAPMDITAGTGSILLRLPHNYAADVALEDPKQQIVVNVPAAVDAETGLTILNGGGPLLRLKSTKTVSVLSTTQQPETPTETAEADPFEGTAIQPVPFVTESPTIDGNLSESAWRAAEPLAPFQNPDGEEIANNRTETFLMWNTENFYIGVKAYLPDASIPYISQTQHDSPIWEDECIEILVDPAPQTDTYYHLVVNAIGAVYDQQVDVPGQPSFWFAPRDVQRTLIRRHMQTSFKGEQAWRAKATVATRIQNRFWTLEAAIPLRVLESRGPSKVSGASGSESKKRWLLNIHRKMHSSDLKSLIPAHSREYSSWLPTYQELHPWWPHSPQEYVGALSGRRGPAMGVLELRRPPAVVPEATFQVHAVEIKGNHQIPTQMIQRRLPIQPGDVIETAHLSRLIAELRESDRFQDVRLETEQVPNGTGLMRRVIVRIRVTEAPLLFAESINITGNRSFPSQFIKDWFDLEPGYLPVESVRLKQRLISDFYLNRQYEFAKVTYQRTEGVLEFRVDEGRLHAVRFTGNSRIPRAELLSALNLNPSADEVYYHAKAQAKINGMEQELVKSNAHFKRIRDWRVQREGGKNVMVVEIEERVLPNYTIFPILQFNRVHGLTLGAGGGLATRLTGNEQVFGSLSHGVSSTRWNYQAGIEKRFFQQRLRVGAGYYKLTDVSSDIYLTPIEVSLSAAYYGSSLKDYYQRQGTQGWITYAPADFSYLRLAFTAEQHDNLPKATDWSYLNRHRLKRWNPRIARGQFRSLSLVYAFDTRDHKSSTTRHFRTLFYPNERTRRGWRGEVSVEIAGQPFGGDHAFNAYGFSVVRYTPIFGPHHFNVRVAGDFSDAPLPRQRWLHLGGATTLRGYDFNAFAGDNRILLNAEYRIIQELFRSEEVGVFGWTLGCFLDTGSVWWYDTDFADIADFFTRIKTSVGVGVSLFVDPPENRPPWSLAVEFARPLNDSFSLENRKVILRLERMF